MDTMKEVADAINKFFLSENNILLLTGTNSQDKIKVALSSALTEYKSPASVLLRVNSKRNAQAFIAPVLSCKIPGPGKAVKISKGNELYVDTMSRRTWYTSPNYIDLVIVYPIDSLKYDEGGECIENLLSKKAKKILLVSWVDNVDLSWADKYNPVHLTYDATKEHPDRHEQLMNIASKTMGSNVPMNLPKYAKSTDPEYLVKIYCRNKCGCSRWAKLNKQYPGIAKLKKSRDYTATCLKCGNVAFDSYNWFGRK